MKTRDLAATCKLYRLVLLQGGRHVASQRPTFTARENVPPRDHPVEIPYATPTRQRPLSKTAAAAWGLCAHGIVEYALWEAGKGMAMTIRKMEYRSAC